MSRSRCFVLYSIRYFISTHTIVLKLFYYDHHPNRLSRPCSVEEARTTCYQLTIFNINCFCPQSSQASNLIAHISVHVNEKLSLLITDDYRATNGFANCSVVQSKKVVMKSKQLLNCLTQQYSHILVSA